MLRVRTAEAVRNGATASPSLGATASPSLRAALLPSGSATWSPSAGAATPLLPAAMSPVIAATLLPSGAFWPHHHIDADPVGVEDLVDLVGSRAAHARAIARPPWADTSHLNDSDGMSLSLYDRIAYHRPVSGDVARSSEAMETRRTPS